MTIRQVGGILAGALVVGYGIFYAGQHKGKADEQAKEAKIEVLKNTLLVAKAETVLKRDTVTLRRVLTKFDSVRVHDTALVTIERPGKPETTVVYVPRSVADTVAATCSRLMRDCGALSAAKDSLIASLRLQVKAVQATKPGFIARWSSKVLWGAAGVGVGALISRR